MEVLVKNAREHESELRKMHNEVQVNRYTNSKEERGAVFMFISNEVQIEFRSHVHIIVTFVRRS